MPALRIKFLIAVTCLALVVLAGTVPAGANCGSPLGVGNTKPGTTPFNSCGANAIGGFWAHKLGVWNVGTGSTAAGGTGGDDSGSFTASLIDLGGGSYKFAGDWGNSGVDGCIQTITGDNGASGNACIGACDTSGLLCQPPSIATCDGVYDTVCNGTADLVPTDFVVGGQANDTSGRATQSTAYFGSVDLNECKQSYAVEDSGAPAGTGGPCTDGTQCLQIAPQQNCAPVPRPAISSFTAGPGGNQTTLNLSFPAQSVPYTDDCANAASKNINCPRQLSGGRALVMRRGLCTQPPRNDTSVWLATFARNNVNSWHPYNATDLDYNGFPDATPTVPSTANIIAQNAGTTSIVITASSGRCYAPNTCQAPATNVGAACISNNDCIGGPCGGGALSATTCTADTGCTVGAFTRCAACLYLGLVAVGDVAPQAGKTPMLAPYVSINTNPISLAGTAPTPATDRVMDLVASKTGGKATVSWDTSSELNTAGFKVMGQRKTGEQFQIGPSFVEATGKTDGQPHHYSVDLNGGDLKGATKIYIVVVHPTGADETFGPANL
jgi:hypothetical protein